MHATVAPTKMKCRKVEIDSHIAGSKGHNEDLYTYICWLQSTFTWSPKSLSNDTNKLYTKLLTDEKKCTF